MTGAANGTVRVRADSLSDTAVAAMLEERRRRFAAGAAVEIACVDVLLWTIGNEFYGTLLIDIWEVMAPVPLTAVPGAPATLAGIFSRRGVIHNLFDPAVPLGATADAAASYQILVLRHDRPRLALRVETAQAIVEIPEDKRRHDGLSHFVVARSGERLALVDTARLIERLLARSVRTEG